MAEAGAPAALRKGSVLLGFALAAVGLLILPLGDAIGKHLGLAGMHPFQIAWGRWVFHFLALTPVVLVLHGRRSLWPVSPGLHVLRSAMLCIANVSYFFALLTIPLANAAAILFVSPLIVTALSGLMLGERVGRYRWSAVAIGFLGVTLVVRPQDDGIGWGSIFALVAATAASFYFLFTRKVAGRNPPMVSLWIMGAIGSALMTPLVLPVWMSVDAQSWLLIASLGAIMALGHLLVIWGFEYGEASAMAPLPYLEIVTATLIGYVWFGDFPQPLTWAGCAVVIAAGLYVAYRERRVQGTRVDKQP